MVEEEGGPFHYCNGVARDDRGRLLIIEADGLLRREPDGTIDWLVEDFGAVAGDGMAADVEGNVFVCCPGDGRLRRVTPTGEVTAIVAFDESSLPTNCCFGGPDRRDLFVTLALARTMVKVTGLSHPGVAIIAWPVP